MPTWKFHENIMHPASRRYSLTHSTGTLGPKTHSAMCTSECKRGTAAGNYPRVKPQLGKPLENALSNVFRQVHVLQVKPGHACSI